MSTVGKKPSKIASARPRSGGASVRYKSNIKQTSSQSSIPDKPKRGLEWTLPAYSICPKSKKGLDWDEIQKKVMRRQAPAGEDIKQIREALKELKNKKIPVHEFVTLVSPYTADNGVELRSVLADDVDTFQRMARRVYETMTQDISDVLTNDQIDTVHFYQERHDLMMEKMMRAINEIYTIVPEFDFENFYKLKDAYLEKMLPLPEQIMGDRESEETRKRQEAYHRLQWLRNEGERMTEENRRLQTRLNQLKEQQQMEQIASQEAQLEMEAQRVELEKEESKIRDQLHQLNEDVERSIIEIEDQEVKSSNEQALESKSHSTQVRKVKKGQKNRKRQDWVTANVQDMETTAAYEAIANEAAALPPPPNLRRLQRDNLELSYQPSGFLPQTDDANDDVIVETVNVTSRSRREAPSGRRCGPPRDTWGGFQ